MSTIEVIYKICKLPVDIIIAIIKYYIGGTEFRKYANRLKLVIKLTIYRFALSLPLNGTKLLEISNKTVLKLFRAQYPRLVGTLPSYGERYGNHGIWIAKDAKRDQTDPIIIYGHGGGYFLQTQFEQLRSLVAIYKNLDPSKRFSILLLDYDLIFERQFPRQLRQLDALYSSLVEDGNDNIILMGDSAGGHLAISYIQYIYSHKPYLPEPTQLVLVSPWVKMVFDTKLALKPGKSYHDNESRDLISIKYFKPELHEIFFNPKNIPYHPYFNWSIGNETNWSDIPFFKDPSKKIFLIYGEDESFRDHIIEWVNEIYGPTLSTFRTNNKYSEKCKTIVDDGRAKLESYMEPWGIHDALFFTEYEVINDLQNAKSDKYFGVSKVINFLNN